MDSLEDSIRKIVTSHSGGIKFLTLITELQDIYKRDCPSPETIEHFIRNLDNIRILDYTWRTLNRAKMFVYTP